MSACESKLLSRSSRKATVANTTHRVGPCRSCDCMPSLVGDRGPVVRVLGWALTRIRNIYCWYNTAVDKLNSACVWNQSRELFSDIRGRGGASNAYFHS